jgi:DNA-binding response OmpR family regulator
MMSGGPHIMVVDDEPAARDMVGDYLKIHGFEVTLCDGGASLRQSMAERRPDLIVLDLNMPEEDGLSIVRDLKARSPVPVIMLTATASLIDRVVGLELGADDYIPKPCELRELVARIRSVLRRGIGVPAQPQSSPGAAEPATNRVRIGTKWFDVDNPKRVLSRDRLLDLADARDPDAFDRSIDVRINRIRKKIEPDPGHPRYIKTVRGLGYVFRPDGD